MGTGFNDKPTGNAGTMRIYDNGSTAVEFLIACSDGATTVGSFVWSGIVNGAPVGGTVSLPAGFGQRSLGAWTVTASQTVSFHMNATGTSGLGGPTDHAVAVSRASPPTAPGPVAAPTLLEVRPDQVRFSWPAPASNGGAAITQYQWVVELPSGSDVVAGTTPAATREAVATGLTPGTAYTVRVRAYNSVGTTPWTSNPNTTPFTTVPLLQVSDGAAWLPALAISQSDGTAWRPVVGISQSNGTAWLPAV